MPVAKVRRKVPRPAAARKSPQPAPARSRAVKARPKALAAQAEPVPSRSTWGATKKIERESDSKLDCKHTAHTCPSHTRRRAGIVSDEVLHARPPGQQGSWLFLWGAARGQQSPPSTLSPSRTVQSVQGSKRVPSGAEGSQGPRSGRPSPLSNVRLRISPPSELPGPGQRWLITYHFSPLCPCISTGFRLPWGRKP